MRQHFLALSCALLALLVAPLARGTPSSSDSTALAAKATAKTHKVRRGDTLGGIARRYKTTVAQLQKLNRLGRRTTIRLGQKLVVSGSDVGPAKKPSKGSASKPVKTTAKAPKGVGVLNVPGAGPAYYFAPIGRGRLGLRPVLMYLHGRGGNPKADCLRWAKVARRMGWVVCPSGPADRGNGRRAWNNDWPTGRRVVKSTLAALRKKFGRRVQLYGNTLIGFSEGAFVAMNVGVREPRAFNRWLILAADDKYWGGPGRIQLKRARRRVRRVYLITGKKDGTYDGTLTVKAALAKAGVAVKSSLPKDMGHEVPLESRAALYRAALTWLVR